MNRRKLIIGALVALGPIPFLGAKSLTSVTSLKVPEMAFNHIWLYIEMGRLQKESDRYTLPASALVSIGESSDLTVWMARDHLDRFLPIKYYKCTPAEDITVHRGPRMVHDKEGYFPRRFRETHAYSVG